MPDWMLLVPLILLPGIAVAWFGIARRKRDPMAPADPDREILRSLSQSGVDLTRETELSFYLYFPNPDQARTASGSFSPPQWHTTTTPSSGSPLWKCTATTRAVPALETVRDLAAHCRGVAEASGGEYDGWQITSSGQRG